MQFIGGFIVPLFFAVITIFGFVKKVPLLDTFVVGVKKGIKTTIGIVPSIIALVIAINMLKSSGFLDILSELSSPVCNLVSIPKEILPLCLIRPVSGSGANAIFNDLITQYGPDSIIGKTASVIVGSTETTFYAVAIYYGAIGIKRSGATIPCALMADITSMIISCILIKFGI
ncbi:MAG: spore maturation protein [Clostridia bacterium]|nr:spore maturation protein [Clostridia bacterium]